MVQKEVSTSLLDVTPMKITILLFSVILISHIMSVSEHENLHLYHTSLVSCI
jgi:hypothetical protein